MSDIAEAIRQRVLASPDAAATLAMAVKTQMPWLSTDEVADQARHYYADFHQLGVLTPLLEDPAVTDILVNAPDDVRIVRSEQPPRMIRTTVTFANETQVRTLAARLAAHAGRLLDDAHPFVDLEYSGLRIHVLLPPLAARGTTISIRRIQRRADSLTALVPQHAEALRSILDSRANFLITGGTGSGKTTLLGAMVRALDERIVVIEDTMEISAGGNCISLQARNPNAEGRGEVTMRELIRQSLRMRPDRIIVGEVRGAEIVDLLAALNTGHAGSGGTIHARSITDLPSRVEALAVFAGVPQSAAHSLLLSAIDVVIHLRSPRDGHGIESIGRLVRDGDRAVIVDA